MAVTHSGADDREITFDGATSGSIFGVSAGANRLLVVSYAVNQGVAGNEPSAATYGGVAMVKQVTVQHGTAFDRASIYTHVAPTTAGQNVAFTLPAAGSGIVAIGAYAGVDQSTPVSAFASNTGNASPATVTCTTAAGEIVVDAVCVGGASTALAIGADQTLIHDHVSGGTMAAAASRQNGASGGVMSWTHASATSFASAAVSLKATTAPGISFVDVSAPVEVASGNLTLTEPAGVASGDLLVACIAYKSTAAFSVPSGWTLVQQNSLGNTATNATAIGSAIMAYIVRGGSAPALAFTRTAGDVALGRIAAYRGVHPTTPFDVSGIETDGTATGTHALNAGLTTTQANTFLVMASCYPRSGAISNTATAATDPITGWVERADSLTTTGSDSALAISDALKDSAGATGALSWTTSGTGRAVTIVAAFRPAPGAYSLSATTGAFALAGLAVELDTPWKPFELGASLLGWWDADNPANFTLEDTNTRVTSWIDEVGGYTPTQATGIAARPVYDPTGFGGEPTVEFDGVNHHVTLDSVPFPTGASPCEIWALVDQTMAPADVIVRIAFSYGASANVTRRVGRYVSGGVNRARAYVGTGGAQVTASDASVDLTGVHILRGRFEAAQTGISVDGGTMTFAAAVPATGTSRTRIGSNDGDPSGLRWQGSIPVVLVTGLLTTEQAAELQDWLEARIPSAAVSITADVGTFALAGQATNFARSYVLAVDAGAFALAGSATNFARGFGVTAEPGAFALSGNAANFPRSYSLAAAAQAFTLAGAATNLSKGYTIVAAAGALALSGQAVNFARGYGVTADVGAFALSGPATGLLRVYSITAGAGAFSLAGPATGLAHGYALIADAGAFALAGTATGLVRGKSLTANTGAFALVGNAAVLTRGARFVTAAAGTFTLAGNDARLLFTTVLADIGDFAVFGNDAILRTSGRVLTAAPASFTVTGSDARLALTTVLADIGEFVLAGGDAGLSRGRIFPAAAGSFTLAGNAAGLFLGRVVQAASGTFATTGNDVAFPLGLIFPAAPATFSTTGNDATFLLGRAVEAAAGTFAVTRNAAGLLADRRVPADAGAFSLSGSDAGRLIHRRITAEAAAYTLTGNAAALSKQGAISMTAVVGAFALSGSDVRVSLTMSAGSAGYVLAGPPVNLNAGPALAAAPGAFALAGSPVDIRRTHIMPAIVGSYSFAAPDIGFKRGISLTAASGDFVLDTSAVTMRRGYILELETGAYSLTGIPANLFGEAAEFEPSGIRIVYSDTVSRTTTVSLPPRTVTADRSPRTVRA